MVQVSDTFTQETVTFGTLPYSSSSAFLHKNRLPRGENNFSYERLQKMNTTDYQMRLPFPEQVSYDLNHDPHELGAWEVMITGLLPDADGEHPAYHEPLMPPSIDDMEVPF